MIAVREIREMIFFKILINPVSGWKELRRSELTPTQLLVSLLVPMSLAAGASNYFSMLYDPLISFGMVTVEAIVTFFTYFLSYYFAIVVSKLLLPTPMKTFPGSRFGQLMTNVCISSLAMFYVFSTALRFIDMILVFLPIWTMYLIFKAMGFVKLEESKSTYTLCVECIVILCSPLVIDWFFSLIVNF